MWAGRKNPTVDCSHCITASHCTLYTPLQFLTISSPYSGSFLFFLITFLVLCWGGSGQSTFGKSLFLTKGQNNKRETLWKEENPVNVLAGEDPVRCTWAHVVAEMGSHSFCKHSECCYFQVVTAGCFHPSPPPKKKKTHKSNLVWVCVCGGGDCWER